MLDLPGLAGVMQNFGKYEIVGKIGEGGFGVVYEAFDPRIERRVAIKTCPTDDSTLRQRFLHEARISGSLNHRHIIVVYDYGEEDDTPYLVQEFLTGEDLDRKISRGDDLSLETKVEYLIQAAEGLDYAHRQGIIHRDIKPSNVRILDDGLVKIMDFGIAKLRDSEVALTLPGQTVGTPAYLAPEQIRALELDARCDIYAFGLLGYELLTYHKAYPSKNASRVLYQILNEEPKPLTEHWPECPEDLAAVLERCYRKDRDERWASLEEVAQALRGVVGDVPTELPGPALSDAVDRNSETMVTPGGTLEDARRAIQEAAAERTHSTRSADRTAATSAAVERPSVGPASGTTAPGRTSLEDLQLGGLGTAPVNPADVTPSSPKPNKHSGGRTALLAGALAVVAVGAWLGLRLLSPAPASEAESPPATTQSAAESEPFEPVAAATTSTPAAEPPSSTASQPTEAAPPPRSSILVLRASWDPRMTATVGDRAPLLLDQDRTVELEAGEPVTVTFTSGRPDFSVSETLELDAERPERTVVETPIARPGALTVRAGLGAPRLQVSLDGERIGWTPINARLVRPGPHSIVVSSDDSDTPDAERSYELEIDSQEEVVLTFDLRRATPGVARRPYRN